MTWVMIVLGLAVIAAAGVVVAVLLVRESRRRVAVRRAAGDRDERALAAAESVERFSSSMMGTLATVAQRLPGAGNESDTLSVKLLRAGFTGENAVAVFLVLRVLVAVVLPVGALFLVSRDDLTQFVLLVGVVTAIGLLGPQGVLDRLTARRQETIRRGIPDTLDLLVVCLEAGVALDSAMQRVSRELGSVHPLLADELLTMTRRVTAGVPRELAMDGLFVRTGVDELRTLASNMVQSEKWGTSIVTVLRVFGDQLRRRRRMEAEKRAATASTRMLFPLMVFIFPVIFIVLLGPAMLRIGNMFDQL
jgi:tight adherence protein C